MKDWLYYYNQMDIDPFKSALQTCFKSFFDNFQKDPTLYMSLPKLAQDCMFQQYPSNHPLVWSFAKKNLSLALLFRKNLVGGLVNLYHRHLSTDESAPENARRLPNGEKLTKISFYDVKYGFHIIKLLTSIPNLC